MIRKVSTIGVVTLALGLGITAQASAGPSDPPSCFGQSVATFAAGAPRALGTFVSESAAFFNETGAQSDHAAHPTGGDRFGRDPGVIAGCALATALRELRYPAQH